MPADADQDGAMDDGAGAEWEYVRQRCLALAVAILEEAR
jgi:hypothetical protein